MHDLVDGCGTGSAQKQSDDKMLYEYMRASCVEAEKNLQRMCSAIVSKTGAAVVGVQRVVPNPCDKVKSLRSGLESGAVKGGSSKFTALDSSLATGMGAMTSRLQGCTRGLRDGQSLVEGVVSRPIRMWY